MCYSTPTDQVADTCSSLSHLSSPLHPYLDSAVSKLSPVLESGYTALKIRVEDRLPEVVSDNIAFVKDQV